ncbi:MAG: DUF2628 domain-containing protein [Nitrospirales bacterium]
MKACSQCGRDNPEEANFCLQCGTNMAAPEPEAARAEEGPAVATDPLHEPDVPGAERTPFTHEAHLWRAFIGPNADRYFEQFRKLTAQGRPQFALTWHWPAFLFDPFLWFLYRKMYLYALVYAIGPVISAYLTGDMTVGIVWRIMAGATANYLYYWHVREHLQDIRKQSDFTEAELHSQLHDNGGVQPYVLYLGIALHVLFLVVLLVAYVQGPPPDGIGIPGNPAR